MSNLSNPDYLRSDPDYLRSHQYNDSRNLGARIRLHEMFSTNNTNFHRWSFDLLLASLGTKGTVLEVGCGRGDLWQGNNERIPNGWDVTLTDFSDGMLDDAQRFIGTASEKMALRVVDAQNIPYPDHSFDLVVAAFMLYHVPNIAQAIRELRRVLKPEGVLHATTLGITHMREIRLIANDIAPDLLIDNEMKSRPFTLENGAEQIRAAFEQVQLIRYDDSLSITEAQPLMDYLLSMWTQQDISNEQITHMTQALQEKIAETGSVRITKDTGVFVARGHV